MNLLDARQTEMTQDSDEWQSFWSRLIEEYDTLCRELEDAYDEGNTHDDITRIYRRSDQGSSAHDGTDRAGEAHG